MVGKLIVELACIALCVTPLCGCLHTGRLKPYTGQWVLESNGENLMVLRTRVHHGRIVGTLDHPKHFRENQTGEFSSVRLPLVTRRITHSHWDKGVLVLMIGPPHDQDHVRMSLTDFDDAYLDYFNSHVPDLHFHRVPSAPRVEVARDWHEFSLDPKIAVLQRQLASMAKEDQTARSRRQISEAEIEELATKDRPLLNQIFSAYQWPKLSLFGVDACDNFWLLVQHQSLALQQKMLPALQSAVAAGEASKTNYAYLFDRVQVNEGKPQHWGTQAKCEGGHAILDPVDDAAHLAERRAKLALPPVSEYLQSLKDLCGRIPTNTRFPSGHQ